MPNTRHKKSRRRSRDRKQQTLYAVTLIIALVIFLVSMFQILRYVWEFTESWKLKDDMIKKAVKTEVTATDTDLEEGPTETAPITVDFEALQQENEDVVAWIYCPDTVINYPIVQAKDNDYYLHRLLNGKQNSAGTLFLDYRNLSVFSDLNSVVYGHHMKNGSMFASLVDYYKQEYYDEHPVMYLLTPKADYKVELLVGYVTDAVSDIYSFPLTEERKDTLLKEAMQRSTFVSNVTTEPGDRLLTLSTCTYDYDDARYVVVGVLRELKKQTAEEE